MPPIFSRLARTLALPLALSAAGAASSSAQSSAPSAASDSASEDLINADRPGIADGSRVIEPGQIQLEIAAQGERHTDANSRTTLSFAPTLLRIGTLHQLELRIESNTFAHAHVVAHDGSVDNSSGLSPVLFGFKLALYDSRDDDRISVGTILRVAPPSGSNGFNTSHPIGDLRLAADWDFAPKLSLNPNVGVARYEGSDGMLFTTALGALTLTYQPSPRLSPFVDFGYQSREDTEGTWTMIADAGVGYVIGRNVQLDVSAGTGAHGDTTPRPFIAVGISVRASPFQHRSR
ncbi:MAG: transporter [bacterium]